MSQTKTEPLRVALVAGTLGKGGAEKQLLMMVRALRSADVNVRVYCTTRGEHYESELKAIGCPPHWIGQRSNPLSRLSRLTFALRSFRPHIIQSAHFYTNLYVALASRSLGTLGFGAMRNDAVSEVEGNGRWGPWLIRLPKKFIVNSSMAKRNAASYGVSAERIEVLSNVLDLADFDLRAQSNPENDPIEASQVATAFAVGRLVRAKRMDRFITAIAKCNESTPVRGIIVGDGPLRSELEAQATELGLGRERLCFVGWRDDLPNLLNHADFLVSSSDHEGFPNVLLEAMAASIPSIGTPAGEVADVICDNETGFVVPFDDIEQLTQRMLDLVNDPLLRIQMGDAARARVVAKYSSQSLGDQLFELYRKNLTPKIVDHVEQFHST